MILYNVTVSIDPSIEEDWLAWMQKDHIPKVINTGVFSKCLLSKINGNEEAECTFSVMYWAKSQTALEDYFENQAPLLQKEHGDRYQGKFGAFRTTLNIIAEF